MNKDVISAECARKEVSTLTNQSSPRTRHYQRQTVFMLILLSVTLILFAQADITLSMNMDHGSSKEVALASQAITNAGLLTAQIDPRRVRPRSSGGMLLRGTT